MDDFKKLDEKSLGKWKWLQHCNIVIPPPKKESTNNVGLKLIVGDILLQFTISIEHENLKLMTSNITFSVMELTSAKGCPQTNMNATNRLKAWPYKERVRVSIEANIESTCEPLVTIVSGKG